MSTDCFVPSAVDVLPVKAEAAGRVNVVLSAGLLAAVVIVSEVNFRIRGIDETSLDWQSLLKAAGCALCGLYGLMQLPRTLPLVCRFPGAWSMLFAVWATLSIAASVMPAVSVSAIIGLWCAVLFVPTAALHLGARRFILVVLATMLLILAGSWYTYYFLPDLGRFPYVDESTGDWNRLGGLQHPNGTAMHAVLAFAMLLALGKMRAFRWSRLIFPMGFTLLTLGMTGSRTGILAALAVALTAWLRGMSGMAKGAVICWLVALVAAAGFVWNLDVRDTAADLARSGSGEEIYSMTGRLDLWKSVVQRIGESPVLGYGYGCSRYITMDNEWHAPHTHNLMLEILLMTGLAGGIFVAAMIIAQVRAFLTRPDNFPDLYLVMILVLGVTEPVLFNNIPTGVTSILWVLCLYWRDLGAPLPGKAPSNRSPATCSSYPGESG